MRKTPLVLLCLVSACLPTKSTKIYNCEADLTCEKIGQGLRCDLEQKICVCVRGNYPDCEQDSSDGAARDKDSALVSEVYTPSASVDTSSTIGAVDGAVVDAPMADLPADTRTVDVEGSCGDNVHCWDRARGFCVENMCSPCTTALCKGVGTGGLLCETKGANIGQCVECLLDGDCKVPGRGFCVANGCTGCNTTQASGCAARNDGKKSCASDGPNAGQCVECVGDAQCLGNAKGEFCVENRCTGCNTPGATGCGKRTDGKILCETKGVLAGKCVECLDESACKVAGRSFCVNDACEGCGKAVANACATRDSSLPVCATSGDAIGQCVECVGDSNCLAGSAKSFCVKNVCSSCETEGASGCAGRADGNTVCATAGDNKGKCVACAVDAQCAQHPLNQRFCVNNLCTGCDTAGSTGCGTRTDGKTSCATSGNKKGECVECVGPAQCTADATRFCVLNECKGCQDAGAGACTGTTPACATSGAKAGQCVECVGNSDCTVASKKFCVLNVCKGCQDAGAGACTGTTSVCAPAGTPTVGGQCVACLTSSDCVAAKPYCDSYSCRICRKNSECALETQAGVCVLDGTCPSKTAVIFVEGGGTCPGNGSDQQPFCSPSDGAAALTADKSVIVVRGQVTSTSDLDFAFTGRPVLVAGLSSAKILPSGPTAPVVSISAGEVTLRDLTVTTGGDIGVRVTGGATLHMDRCYVLNNAGVGIQTSASAFDITNTVIAGNGSAAGGYGVSLGSYGGSTKRFAFNTVVNNAGGGVYCGAAYTFNGILANANNVNVNFSSNCTSNNGSTAAPAFTSPSSYHLTNGSPCVNSGGTTNCPAYDIDGDTRPQGTTCDCGADEYKP